MSAECGRCGADIVYPVGTWPIGECPVCKPEAEVVRLQARITELEREKDAWRDWIDKPHKDERWQTVLSCLPDEYQHIGNLAAERDRLREALTAADIELVKAQKSGYPIHSYVRECIAWARRALAVEPGQGKDSAKTDEVEPNG